MQKQNQNKIKHVHWHKLVNHDKMKKILDEHDVYVILIAPFSDPENKYDFIAYVHGAGSDYLTKFKHLTDCTWEEV
jgi:hypothetical protein